MKNLFFFSVEEKEKVDVEPTKAMPKAEPETEAKTKSEAEEETKADAGANTLRMCTGALILVFALVIPIF